MVLCAHLVEEPQSLDDPVVEIDQFCFAQRVDVDHHGVPRLATNQCTGIRHAPSRWPRHYHQELSLRRNL
jgi:hypothetical protein